MDSSACQSSPEGATVVQACSQFACDLYKQVGMKGIEENLFMSPFSISVALAMTYLGARSNTAVEMRKTLGLTDMTEDIHSGFAELVQALYSADAGYILKTANKLFGDKSYGFLQEYLQDSMTHYKSELVAVDFQNAFEEARQHINSWVEEQTEEKIKNLLPSGTIDNLTRLVLVNAIYFKGNWMSKFNEKFTKEGDFSVNMGEKVKVPMMFQKAKFHYGYSKDLNSAALEIPYQEGKLSMIIFLPDSIDGLAQLESGLKESYLTNTNKVFEMRKMEVEVTLPRFKLEQSFSLKKILSSMGMKDIFVPGKADLSGLDGSRELYVSHVIHKAFVDVNEEGTEAAAATAVVVQLRCMPMRPTRFRADHPFLFFIKHIDSNVVLFMGRLANPLPQ